MSEEHLARNSNAMDETDEKQCLPGEQTRPSAAVRGAIAVPINHITTNAPTSEEQEKKLTPARRNLRKWLGKTFRVVITDGRVLVGFFNCTDKDANIVLSMCAEYLEEGKDARMLGNVMIPGKHIVSISVDMPKEETEEKVDFGQRIAPKTPLAANDIESLD